MRRDRESTLRERADRSGRVIPERSWSAADRLTLPRYATRHAITVNRTRFRLRESEIDLLSTVGAFRAVQVSDLEPRDASHSGRNEHHTQSDLRSLRQQGLLETHPIVINGRLETVAVLTDTGLDLLERSRADLNHEPRTSNLELRHQQFYSGLLKTRELAHDAQLYRVFQTERTHLEADGATITRIVLDDELKAEYHTYVYEQCRIGVDPDDARRAFARDHDLSFAGGRIHLPDVRIEYTSADGRIDHRDLELATEHYSRAQVSGKQSAGFRVYRAAGARRGSTRGSTPSDPHNLEWLP